MQFGVGFFQEADDYVGALQGSRGCATCGLSPHRGLLVLSVCPTAYAVGCILSPLCGWTKCGIWFVSHRPHRVLDATIAFGLRSSNPP